MLRAAYTTDSVNIAQNAKLIGKMYQICDIFYMLEGIVSLCCNAYTDVTVLPPLPCDSVVTAKNLCLRVSDLSSAVFETELGCFTWVNVAEHLCKKKSHHK